MYERNQWMGHEWIIHERHSNISSTMFRREGQFHVTYGLEELLKPPPKPPIICKESNCLNSSRILCNLKRRIGICVITNPHLISYQRNFASAIRCNASSPAESMNRNIRVQISWMTRLHLDLDLDLHLHNVRSWILPTELVIPIPPMCKWDVAPLARPQFQFQFRFRSGRNLRCTRQHEQGFSIKSCLPASNVQFRVSRILQYRGSLCGV